MSNSHKILDYISIVIYVKDSQTTIQEHLQTIYKFAQLKFEYFEIIVVNNSDDNSTEQAINSFYNSLGPSPTIKLSIINFTRIHSIEDAIRSGLDFAIGDFVIEINLHHFNFEITKIEELFYKAQSGYDLVSLVPETGASFISQIFYRLFSRFAYFNLSIGSEVAYILSRKCINALSNIKDKIYYRRLLYRLVSNRSSEIYYKPSFKTKCELSFNERLNLALDMLFSFTNFGLKITNLLMRVFLFITISAGLYTVYQYICFRNVVSGWTTIMLLSSFGFSSILVILSIITRYVSLILREVKTAPLYFISSIKKF